MNDSPEPLPLVCIILGQTASGKSNLCLGIADRLEGEVISMDAFKVYRKMDIGTAKTPIDEGQNIPHHLTDMVDANEPFNVNLYLSQLEQTIKDIHNRGRLPVIDCGTPLYLKAFMSGILESPDPDPELRAELEAMDSEQLHERLQKLDATAAQSLHVNDRKRVIRAVEFAMQTETPISEQQTQFNVTRNDYRIVLTGPRWSEEKLKERIAIRVDKMIEAGLLDEVRTIKESPGFSKTSREAIGYRQLLEHLDGECSLEEAIEKTKAKTWQLARKQMTWFKRYPQVKWIDTNHEDELKRAAVFLSTELIGEMRETMHGMPIGLKREKRDPRSPAEP